MPLNKTTVNANPTFACKFARVFAGLDEEDQQILKSWVIERSFGTPKIVLGLREDPSIPFVAQDSVGRHLRGECPCFNYTDDLWGVRRRG